MGPVISDPNSDFSFMGILIFFINNLRGKLFYELACPVVLRWLLRNRCARKEQYFLFELFKEID